jgi:NAD(P)-dependent dehydrogenase (short-subunit alcohol dehydrogenase family)
MALHVIVGASGVATARLLADRGDQVKIVTRSGAGPEHPAVERVAADATDAGRLSAIAECAMTLYNCANPPYDQWLTDWPPLASALVTGSLGRHLAVERELVGARAELSVGNSGHADGGLDACGYHNREAPLVP